MMERSSEPRDVGHSATDLDGALAEVRKAYRLVAAYQRRVLDVVDLMASSLGDLKFYQWYAELGRPGNGGTPPRGEWSMLPMADMSLLYLPQGANPNTPKAGDWMLECRIRSDTGVSASTSSSLTLDSAAAARTTLNLYAWNCVRSNKRNWYHGLWSQQEWPEIGGLVTLDSDFQVVSRAFDLAELRDRTSINAAADAFSVVRSTAAVGAI